MSDAEELGELIGLEFEKEARRPGMMRATGRKAPRQQPAQRRAQRDRPQQRRPRQRPQSRQTAGSGGPRKPAPKAQPLARRPSGAMATTRAPAPTPAARKPLVTPAPSGTAGTITPPPGGAMVRRPETRLAGGAKPVVEVLPPQAALPSPARQLGMRVGRSTRVDVPPAASAPAAPALPAPTAAPQPVSAKPPAGARTVRRKRGLRGGQPQPDLPPPPPRAMPQPTTPPGARAVKRKRKLRGAELAPATTPAATAPAAAAPAGAQTPESRFMAEAAKRTPTEPAPAAAPEFVPLAQRLGQAIGVQPQTINRLGSVGLGVGGGLMARSALADPHEEALRQYLLANPFMYGQMNPYAASMMMY